MGITLSYRWPFGGSDPYLSFYKIYFAAWWLFAWLRATGLRFLLTKKSFAYRRAMGLRSLYSHKSVKHGS